MNLLFIGLGGALGAISRYAFSLLFKNFSNTYIQIGVLFVNVLGSFLIGVALAFALHHVFFERNTTAHFFAITGFLGAFTTFSTFSQDNIVFLLDKNITGFFLNTSLNILLGFFACFLGYSFVSKFL